MPARKLLSRTREWPWGLAVLTDPGSSEELPTVLDENGVAAGRSIVAVRVQHQVDGEAVAEVWLGSVAGELACVYDGEFMT